MEAVLGEVGSALADLVDGSTSAPRPGGSEGAWATATSCDAALAPFFDTVTRLKERAAQEGCTVAVLALAKSGKSTLLNALLGEAILPSNNVPETSRIVAIRHAPHGEVPVLAAGADGRPEVRGTQAIRDHLRSLNAAARGGQHSLAASEALLEVSAPVAALAGAPDSELAGRVAILDTPGPNEAGADHLRFKVERLMEGVDAAVYVMDYTKLKTNEETAVLQRLHELNPALVRRLSRRCFFVVNKKDVADSAEGMGEEETREYVAALVTEQMAVPGFELAPEQIFLVSALNALRARQALRPGAAPAEVEAFRQLAFGKAWKRISDPETIRETALEVLADSGVPELEHGVLGFLATRALVLHRVALADDCERLLTQMHNLTSASAASLHRSVEALAAQISQLKASLEATLAQFEDVGREVQELEGLVVDEVRERMGCLRQRLEAQIGEVLSPNRLPTGVPHGRWPAVWSKAKSILRWGRAAQSALDPEGEEQLQMQLSELHSMIYLQIEAEVRDFWHSLEAATNSRQRQLFAAINRRVMALSAAIEGEVGGALDCVLQPVDMRLRPPTAEQFHCNLQELLQRGIQRTQVQETVEVPREHVMYEKRTHHSLCKSYDYWEPTTQTRNEQESVTHTRYNADANAIAAYFTGVVEATTNSSVAAVRRYVRAYLADRVAEARAVLESMSARYVRVMEVALEAAQKGEAERAEALAAARARAARVTELLDRVQALQQQAEEMLDGWGEEPEAVDEPMPTSTAMATMAALAELQGGLSLSASGSTTAEVAAAYRDAVAEVPLHDDGGSPAQPDAAAEAEEEDANEWTVVEGAEAAGAAAGEAAGDADDPEADEPAAAAA